MFAPQGIGLSKMGYTSDQEADVFCTDSSGASGKTKNQGCPDPCAYSLCNEGQSFIVQCPKGCFGSSDAKPVYGQYDRSKKTVVAPYEDQSSICRAAILAGVDPSYGKQNFYATITIVKPVRSYQDEVGAWTRYELWDKADDPTSWAALNVDATKCCVGGWPPKLGAYTPVAKLRQGFKNEWQNVRAFAAAPAPNPCAPPLAYICGSKPATDPACKAVCPGPAGWTPSPDCCACVDPDQPAPPAPSTTPHPSAPSAFPLPILYIYIYIY